MVKRNFNETIICVRIYGVFICFKSRSQKKANRSGLRIGTYWWEYNGLVNYLFPIGSRGDAHGFFEVGIENGFRVKTTVIGQGQNR